MANKELMDALMREKTRLKAACGVLVNKSAGQHILEFGEFRGILATLHMSHYSNMMLRCEFTVFMAMSSEKKFVEEEEFFRRVISQIMFEVKQLEKALDVVVDRDGRVHKSTTPRLIRPG